MRPHVFTVRLFVVTSLVFASIVCGGWKWDFPH